MEEEITSDGGVNKLSHTISCSGNVIHVNKSIPREKGACRLKGQE